MVTPEKERGDGEGKIEISRYQTEIFQTTIADDPIHHGDQHKNGVWLDERGDSKSEGHKESMADPLAFDPADTIIKRDNRKGNKAGIRHKDAVVVDIEREQRVIK